jgi:uncharacterized LabA/DUF88 family protein
MIASAPHRSSGGRVDGVSSKDYPSFLADSRNGGIVYPVPLPSLLYRERGHFFLWNASAHPCRARGVVLLGWPSRPSHVDGGSASTYTEVSADVRTWDVVCQPLSPRKRILGEGHIFLWTRMKTTAVLLDGAFVRKRLTDRLRRPPTAQDVYDFACSAVDGSSEELFRIYYYDCLPFQGHTVNPISGSQVDMGSTQTARYLAVLFETLAQTEHVAFRRGELAFHGWRLKKRVAQRLMRAPRAPRSTDVELDLQQKRVDMKIGLDVAWLSTKRIVERIILCTADSDFVPAMKFARREGVQVVLLHLGARIKPELLEHADVVRNSNWPLRVPAQAAPSSIESPMA